MIFEQKSKGNWIFLYMLFLYQVFYHAIGKCLEILWDVLPFYLFTLHNEPRDPVAQTFGPPVALLYFAHYYGLFTLVFFFWQFRHLKIKFTSYHILAIIIIVTFCSISHLRLYFKFTKSILTLIKKHPKIFKFQALALVLSICYSRNKLLQFTHFVNKAG